MQSESSKSSSARNYSEFPVTNLNQLTVSLTKHGAHKLAKLLVAVPLDNVIASTTGRISGINISESQARKILCAYPDDRLPIFWESAKKGGVDTINGMVLLAIIFSHHLLIDVIRARIDGLGTGTVSRTDFASRKTFTNLKDDFRELGFVRRESETEFIFDIGGILRSPKVGALGLLLFQHKLRSAGWQERNDPVDECINLKLHRVLGLAEVDFRGWVSDNAVDLDKLPVDIDPDQESIKVFKFRPGHTERKTGEVVKKGHGPTGAARLIHNELQNALYKALSRVHGKECVGAEVPSGVKGTSIDLVVKRGKEYVFYEIKTSSSLRVNIRDAMPQLLEYCYWPAEARAVELVIVSTAKPTKDATAYLRLLRSRLKIPVYHATIDARTGALTNRI